MQRVRARTQCIEQGALQVRWSIFLILMQWWLHKRKLPGLTTRDLLLWKVLESIVAADVGADHLLPPWPIVGPAIPDAQGVPDVLSPQNTR